MYADHNNASVIEILTFYWPSDLLCEQASHWTSQQYLLPSVFIDNTRPEIYEAQSYMSTARSVRNPASAASCPGHQLEDVDFKVTHSTEQHAEVCSSAVFRKHTFLHTRQFLHHLSDNKHDCKLHFLSGRWTEY